MDIQYSVSQLDITEHVSYGTGVTFTSWPDENTMLEVMTGIRQALKEYANGDIFWHLNKSDKGWELSGNISTENINEAVETAPLVLSGSARVGKESVG